MNAFAELLEALHHEPARNRKLTLLVEYLQGTPDPDRGYALAALTGSLTLNGVKPALLRALIEARIDPVLFRVSYDFVGDLSETIALLWPGGGVAVQSLGVASVVESMQVMSKAEGMRIIPGWLDGVDTRGRWALLKLVTGSLRVGVSTGLAKQALAKWSGVAQREIEEVWHAFDPPYVPLFEWLAGRSAKPDVSDASVFVSPMLAHPVDLEGLENLDPSDFAAEWKWDGIRVQVRSRIRNEHPQLTLFSRSGDDITAAFPDISDRFPLVGTFDGELVAIDTESASSGGDVSFSALQQRLNRKSISPAIVSRYPARMIVYDLLFAPDATGEIEDLRGHPFALRRSRLEPMIERASDPRIGISGLIDFETWGALAEHRASSATRTGVEGVMLKRREGAYLAGRPQGEWFKWKRDAHLLDCVMMYAQRGHGKRASLYSDFTFGLWEGDRLLPVGKAYFGFTDSELAELDRFVRHNTVNRFGPVREVTHTPESGLVLEIAFEGVQRSTRHKSGFAMRFPRVHRVRRDKLPHEADRLELLARLAE